METELDLRIEPLSLLRTKGIGIVSASEYKESSLWGTGFRMASRGGACGGGGSCGSCGGGGSCGSCGGGGSCGSCMGSSVRGPCR
jgi:hypothetical protein